MESARPSPTDPLPDDLPSWREVVRRLMVHARCLGASTEEAEDLVHDAVEVAVGDRGWFDPDRGSLLAVLKVVLRNRWANRRRSAGVTARAEPRLRLVEPAPDPELPLTAARAAIHRQRFLALLEPDERALFGVWMRQRQGELSGPDAALGLGMSHAGYEAAKKRLRRRCRAVLDELDLTAADLFDPNPGGLG